MMKCYNIPIFVPHYGCPHQCVFCNQNTITGSAEPASGEGTKKIVESYLKTLPRNHARIEAAFFGGSFTAINPELRRELLHAVQPYLERGEIHGIRLSTRPDYIDHDILEELVQFGVTTIELGVQSMDDRVLTAAGRGHSANDVRNAVSKIRQYPFSLGLQMMTGLPKDSPEGSIHTAEQLIAQKPDFVRIYPTLVFSGTKLYELWKSGAYQPQTTEEAVPLCAALYERFFAAGIPVIRIGLPENKEAIAGPQHPSFGELVESECYKNRFLRLLSSHPGKKPHFLVAKRELSKAIGNKRRNLIALEQKTGQKAQIKESEKLSLGEVEFMEKEE